MPTMQVSELLVWIYVFQYIYGTIFPRIIINKPMSRSHASSSSSVSLPLHTITSTGGPRSRECTLILTEGDSAKALAVSGLSVLSRDFFGVFPLRGKLLNVSGATHKQLVENSELSHVIQILGLGFKKDYESLEERETMRYGKVMLMTDQDHDGTN